MEEIQPSEDWVAEIVARWQELRPDLDPSPIFVFGRIARLAVIIDQRLRPPFARRGTSRSSATPARNKPDRSKASDQNSEQVPPAAE